MVPPRRALLSVSDKEGLVEFARGLRDLGFELIGTDGTAKTLKEAGLPVTTVADYTGLREGLGGRVKTLHPRIFAGILAPRGDEKDLEDLGAVAIDLVVANLYPFEETVAKPDVRFEDAVENIDIGGVSLIRAAAKNANRVSVVVRPARYSEVLRTLRQEKTIRRSSGANSRSRRSNTRPDTMLRFSISSPGVRGTSSRRHSGSRMTRLRTSATGRTRIKRRRSTGSRSRPPRRRLRTSCKGRSSPTTT